MRMPEAGSGHQAAPPPPGSDFILGPWKTASGGSPGVNCDLKRDRSPSKAETALQGGRRKAGDPEVRSEFLQGAKQPTPMACRKVVVVARERGGRGPPGRRQPVFRVSLHEQNQLRNRLFTRNQSSSGHRRRKTRPTALNVSTSALCFVPPSAVAPCQGREGGGGEKGQFLNSGVSSTRQASFVHSFTHAPYIPPTDMSQVPCVACARCQSREKPVSLLRGVQPRLMGGRRG